MATASRRVRLKGVANISQRRKPLNQQSEEQESDVVNHAPIISTKDKSPVPTLIKSNLESQINQSESTDLPKLNNLAQTRNSKCIELDTINEDIRDNAVTVKKKLSDTEDTDKKEKTIEAAPLMRRRHIRPIINLERNKRNNETNIKINLNETEITSPCETNIDKPISSVTITIDPASDTPPAPNRVQFIEGTKLETDSNVLERPQTPVSPTKFLNRHRIKAVPRLGQRRVSFSVGSTSESEDDSKRIPKRIRHDSACSVASSMGIEKPDQTDNALMRKEYSSLIQRKCRRTEQSRRLAEAKRDFQTRFTDCKPDRQKLTMMDLIFYNPESNPMSSQKEELNDESIDDPVEEKKVDLKPLKASENGESLEENVSQEDDNTIPAPQIRIGANGEIVLDEKSLVIENKATIESREALRHSKLVDGDVNTSYGVYKRVKRTKDWSMPETIRFYKALNTLGTDFTLMKDLFPNRTRRELKMKFKKEEKVNRSLIDKAVMYPGGFDLTDLQIEAEKEEMAENLKQQRRDSRKKNNIKKTRIRKIKIIKGGLNISTDEDQTDEDEILNKYKRPKLEPPNLVEDVIPNVNKPLQINQMLGVIKMKMQKEARSRGIELPEQETEKPLGEPLGFAPEVSYKPLPNKKSRYIPKSLSQNRRYMKELEERLEMQEENVLKTGINSLLTEENEENDRNSNLEIDADDNDQEKNSQLRENESSDQNKTRHIDPEDEHPEPGSIIIIKGTENDENAIELYMVEEEDKWTKINANQEVINLLMKNTNNDQNENNKSNKLQNINVEGAILKSTGRKIKSNEKHGAANESENDADKTDRSTELNDSMEISILNNFPIEQYVLNETAAFEVASNVEIEDGCMIIDFEEFNHVTEENRT